MKNTALEAISFQGPAFFAALTAAVRALRMAARSNSGISPSELPEGKALGTTLTQHTGLNITLMPEIEEMDLAMMCPRLANGHIFDSVFGWHNASENEFNKDAKAVFNKYKTGFGVGTVDIRKNRVSGLFSEIPFQLYVKDSFITGEMLTDEELASIILHETGHAFTQCEYINRSVYTNQVLADLMSAKNNRDGKEITAIITRMASDSDLTPQQRRALELCKKPEDYVVTAYALADERCRSELGCSVYETTASEHLADMYAARCGAGRHMVTALHKLNRDEWGAYSDTHKAQSVAEQMFLILMVATLSSAWMGMFFGGLVAKAFFSISLGQLGTTITMLSTGSIDYQQYDDPITRFDRIKHQLVHQLKNQSIPRKLSETILSDIEEIDKIVEPLRKLNENPREAMLGHYLGLLFSSSYRKKIDIEQLQKQLEALASNDLFVHAAKLKTL